VRCDHLADRLPAAAEGTVALEPDERAHVERCLRCQADAAQYRRLLRALRQLRSEPVAVPAGLLDDLRAALDHPGRRAGRARRAAYLGGIAAATAATAAGAIVLARSRRRLPLAG
jgi:hypothetical protein